MLMGFVSTPCGEVMIRWEEGGGTSGRVTIVTRIQKGV
jgi:hypothetical protein